MKRRAFLGFLRATAAAPFLINAKPVGMPVAELPPAAAWTPDVSVAIHGGHHTTSVRDGSNKRYQMVQTRKDLKAGDVVYIEEGKPFGVAIAPITADHYGFVQIGGPATVKLA